MQPKIRRELARLKKEISALRAEISRIKRTGISRRAKQDQLELDNLRLQRMGVLFEDREKELYARLASLEDSIKKFGQGYFRAKLVLPGTTVVAGLDTVEFSCPNRLKSERVHRDRLTLAGLPKSPDIAKLADTRQTGRHADSGTVTGLFKGNC